VPLLAGYWRVDLSVLTIQECLYEGACKGGTAFISPGEYCNDGYVGPYCAVCESNYAESFGYMCHDCDARLYKAGTIAVAAAAAIVIIGAFAYTAVDLWTENVWSGAPFSDWTCGGRCGMRGPLVAAFWAIPFSKLRTVVVCCQIIVQNAAVTGTVYPPMLRNYLPFLGFFGLDLSWLLLPLRCLVPGLNFIDRLAVLTITPLFLCALLAASWALVRFREGRKPAQLIVVSLWQAEESPSFSRTGSPPPTPRQRQLPGDARRERIDRKHLTAFFALTFLVYSAVSTAVLQTFACDDLPEVGGRYLRADYSISCDGDAYRRARTFAIFMMLLYPLGIPACYACVLWRQRRLHAARKAAAAAKRVRSSRPKFRETSLGNRRALEATAFLWAPYREAMFGWELSECARRLLLTGLLIFVRPGMAAQRAVASILATLSLGAAAYFSPHADWVD
ncbi:unnamed protein product, partial [Phaeothamnion confervicola]